MSKSNSLLSLRFAFCSSDNLGIIFLVSFLLILLFFLGSVTFNASANNVPRERSVRTQVERLDFLSARQMRSLPHTIIKAAQAGLLDYSSSVGTNTLLTALVNSRGSARQKSELIRLYQTSLSDNLPVFLITRTSIRLLRRRAPFTTVLSTVRRQIHLLRSIKDYVQTEGVSLYLTYQHKHALIDTLAETIEIFLRQQNGGSQEPTDSKFVQLKQIMHNLIRVSALPVSLSSNSNVKGGEKSTDINPQLSRFLSNQSTIETLVRIAEEFNA